MTGQVFNRSRLSNSNGALHPAVDGKIVDGRSALARRWRDLYEEFLAEAAQKGAVTEVRRQLCRRLASLCAIGEVCESRFLLGDQAALHDILSITGQVRSLCSRLAIGARVSASGDENELDWYVRMVEPDAFAAHQASVEAAAREWTKAPHLEKSRAARPSLVRKGPANNGVEPASNRRAHRQPLPRVHLVDDDAPSRRPLRRLAPREIDR